MSVHFLENIGLKSPETNPMAPVENRKDDLAIGFAHRRIDLEGDPKQSVHVAWAGDFFSLQRAPKSPGSEQCLRLAINASCKRKSFEAVLSPSTMATKFRTPEYSSRSPQIICLARGQTILISQGPCPSSPRCGTGLLLRLLELSLIALSTFCYYTALNLLQGGRILWERPPDDDRLLRLDLDFDLGGM